MYSSSITDNYAPPDRPPECLGTYSYGNALSYRFSIGRPPDYISGYCAADIIQDIVPTTLFGTSFCAATSPMAVATDHSITASPSCSAVIFYPYCAPPSFFIHIVHPPVALDPTGYHQTDLLRA